MFYKHAFLVAYCKKSDMKLEKKGVEIISYSQAKKRLA